MSKINALPFGLQEILGNTALGINPDDLSQEVKAQFDIEKYWLLDKIQFAEAQVLTTVADSGVEVEIPDSEIWMPISCSAQYQFTVGDFTSCSIVLTTQPGAEKTFLATSEWVLGAASSSRNRVGLVWPRQVLFGPGTTFGVINNATLPSNRTFNIFVHFHRLLF